MTVESVVIVVTDFKLNNDSIGEASPSADTSFGIEVSTKANPQTQYVHKLFDTIMWSCHKWKQGYH